MTRWLATCVAAVLAVGVALEPGMASARLGPPLPGVDDPEPGDAATEPPKRSSTRVEPPDAAALQPARRSTAETVAPQVSETKDTDARDRARGEARPEGAPDDSARPIAPPPRVGGDGEVETLAVAIGLGPDTAGLPEENAVFEDLAQSVPMSVDPPTTVREIKPGTAPRIACEDAKDDLVIVVGYLPDRVPPVLLTHDCRLDVPLGVRAKSAASNPDLIGVLWDEHDDLLEQGFKERKARRLNPKVRSALIIGGATVAIGVALGLILANTLRDEVVVLKVSP